MKDHLSDRNTPDPIDRDSVADSWGRTAAYDAYADGLHTYALGGLRNHEAAAAAVYCTFVAADHHVAHLSDAEVLRPWLYAITRYYCRLGGLPRMRLIAPRRVAGGEREADSAMAGLERNLLQAELSSLDWPDTDGLASAHREVLELSVRHGLESKAVGIMLSRPAAESFELLSAAWHELERTLAAMALLRTTREHCSDLAELARGWSGRMTAQRREPIVAHVDGCSRCQYYLHKVVGTPQAPTILPHVAAPAVLRAKVLGDLVASSPEIDAEKAAIAGRLVRFDRFGFPMAAVGGAPKPVAVAPGVARQTGVRTVAVGAPVSAAYGATGGASHRPASARGRMAERPLVGDTSTRPSAGVSGFPAAGRHTRSRGFRSALTSSAVLGGVAAAGGTAFVLLIPSSPATKPLLTQDPGFQGGVAQAPDIPVPTTAASVVPVAGASARPNVGLAAERGGGQSSVILQAVVVPMPRAVDSVFVTTPPAQAGPPTLPASPPPLPPPSSSGQGVLNVAVSQRSNNPGQLTVTLWDSGTAPVSWTAAADAPYLKLDKTSGTIAPGTQQAVQITVDQAAAPQGPWQAHVRFDPGGQSVTLSGGTVPTPPPTTSPSTPPSTSPSTSPTTSPSTPTGTPSSSPTSTTASPTPHPTTSSTSPGGQPSRTSTPPSTPPPSTPPPTTPPTVPPTTSAPATSPSHP